MDDGVSSLEFCYTVEYYPGGSTQFDLIFTCALGLTGKPASLTHSGVAVSGSGRPQLFARTDGSGAQPHALGKAFRVNKVHRSKSDDFRPKSRGEKLGF